MPLFSVADPQNILRGGAIICAGRLPTSFNGMVGGLLYISPISQKQMGEGLPLDPSLVLIIIIF